MAKLNSLNSASLGAQNQKIATMATALQGDITMTIDPETVNRSATSSAWTRNVTITLVDSNGLVHNWLNDTFATTLSIADTSTAGTASIGSTTLTIVEGKAVVTVSGDAQDWLATETDTLTVGNITVNGNTVTGGTSVQTFV